MTAIIPATQKAAAAALLAHAGVLAIVAVGADGPAVFAPGQAFDDVYPRVTLEPPQRLDRSTSCSKASDMIVTAHSWAQGPDCTLVAGELADAVEDALSGALAIEGHRVSSQAFEATRSAGDPRDDVAHLVTTFRYSTQPAG